MNYTELEPRYTYIPAAPVAFEKTRETDGFRWRRATISCRTGEGNRALRTILFHIKEEAQRPLGKEKTLTYRVEYGYTPTRRDGEPGQKRVTATLIDGVTMREAKAFLRAITPSIVKANVYGEILWHKERLHAAVVAFSLGSGIDCSALYDRETVHLYEEAMADE